MLLSFLNKPYPGGQFSKRNVIQYLLIGCFVAFFLVVFQPFGIGSWITDHKILKLSGFGIVSFFAPLSAHFLLSIIIPKKITEDNWTVLKEIIMVVFVLVVVAFGNLLYGNFLHIFPISFQGFLAALLVTVLLGIFPVGLQVVNKHNRFFKANKEQAVSVNEQLQHTDRSSDEVLNIPGPGEETKKPEGRLVFTADNEKEIFEIDPAQLLYIESADNYCEIFYTDQAAVKKHLIRSSLKRLEQQNQFDFIIRCHRAFIVNLKNVRHVEGNAAGYKLGFTGTANIVPVSRSYAQNVIERLKSSR